MAKKKSTKTTSNAKISKSTKKKTSTKSISSEKISNKKTTKKTTKKNTEKTSDTKSKIKLEETKDKEEQERIESYIKAGEIAQEIKVYIRPKIKVGAKLIDIINDTEDKIIELGGRPGFPVNISINHIAAHYTSPLDDTTQIQDGDIIKIDFGVHINGYSVDCAFTINFNDEPSLKNIGKASEEAVKKAISMIKPGIMTNELGAEIEKIVKSYGYKPIINLNPIQRFPVSQSSCCLRSRKEPFFIPSEC